MKHVRILAILATTLMVVAAVPAIAAPPSESGVVVRIADDEGFGIFPDVENGYWVFSNVTRDAFCLWFDNMETEPPPTNEDADDVMLVFASDAVVISVHAGGPTALHAFAGDGPGDDPCSGSEEESALTGDVKVHVNDNDGPNEGKRANSFGDRGQGTLTDADGNLYHYSWSFRGLWNPEGTEFRVLHDFFNLKARGS